MSIWQPGDEDVLSFEWDTGPEDPGNIYFTLDEQSPEQALRVRIGGMTGVLAADEALTLLDWLGEREGTLFALTKQQPIVAPDQAKEEQR
jgi:hypothetical protein